MWHTAATKLLDVCAVARYSPYQKHLKKSYARIFPLFFWVMSRKNMGPIIHAALTAHHTPNLVSSNGTFGSSLGLSTD